MAETTEGCVRPAPGVVAKAATPAASGQQTTTTQEEVTMSRPMVGTPAPDFAANGYQGNGFRQFKLSEYKGKWVMLCFYPGDFTFV